MRSHLATHIRRALLPQQPARELPAEQAAAPAATAGDDRILVVGAGLAGLVVAHRLQGYGAVDIIEGRSRIGGRILSQANCLNTGRVAELGGETFDSDHVASLALAAELGLTVVDLHQQPPLSTIYWFQGQQLTETWLTQELAAVSLADDLKHVAAFRAGAVTPQVVALDRQSIVEYMANRGASPLLQAVVRVAFTIKYGLDAEQQSSLNMLNFFCPGEGFNLFGASDERYYLAGGNGQLVQRLAATLAPQIELDTVLEALQVTPAGRYRVSLRCGSGSCDRSYDRVVLTVPFNLLRHIPLAAPISPQQRLAINSLGYNSPTKVITAHRYRPWVEAGVSGLVYSDRSWQHTWEASDSLAATGAALLVQYPGGHQGQYSSRHPQAQAIEDLEVLFPGLQASRLPGLLSSPWLQDPFSQGAYACYTVGQWTTLHGSEGQHVDHLYFAGEHCSRRYQGYMEGATETGEAVALAILRTLSRPGYHHQQKRLKALETKRRAIIQACSG